MILKTRLDRPVGLVQLQIGYINGPVRSYNLLHANYLFLRLKKRCNFQVAVAEVDRILRPERMLIVRDTAKVINELENIVKSMNWEVYMTYTKENEDLLGVRKSMWQPTEIVTLEYVV
ncbi:hypothetical protein AHAS_Ahas20G0123300 [Arachis hypogaea]